MSPLHETLRFTREVSAPRAALWEAFAEPSQRVIWAVPAGEIQVYDQAQFEIGGQDRYRCGPPGSLDYRGLVDYLQIIDQELIVHTDVVHAEDQILSAALLTVEFSSTTCGSRIEVTDQLVSFVGEGMVQGHQTGQRMALDQLAAYLKSRHRQKE